MPLFALTSLTMIAFAANSVLARLALLDGGMDAGSYTAIRLVAGAIMLALLVARSADMRSLARTQASLPSALALFGYAAGFSLAYLTLDTGIGALILFAMVQATMIGWAIFTGDRPTAREWIGLVVAFGAFVYLVSPGLDAPDVVGTVLMAAAGIAWGIYSLRGRGAGNPLAMTAGNFVLAAPLGLAMAAALWSSLTWTPATLAYAVLSGAITSGLGYALWYRVLPQLGATRGAIVQLTVPVIAAAGGIAFAGEPLTLRFAVASVLILGGVGFAIVAKSGRST